MRTTLHTTPSYVCRHPPSDLTQMSIGESVSFRFLLCHWQAQARSDHITYGGCDTVVMWRDASHSSTLWPFSESSEWSLLDQVVPKMPPLADANQRWLAAGIGCGLPRLHGVPWFSIISIYAYLHTNTGTQAFAFVQFSNEQHWQRVALMGVARCCTIYISEDMSVYVWITGIYRHWFYWAAWIVLSSCHKHVNRRFTKFC